MSRFRIRNLSFCAAALALYFTTEESPANAKMPEITAVKIGYQGTYKLGHWTPVEVKFKPTAATGDVEFSMALTAADGNGDAVRYVANSVRRNADGTFSAAASVRFGSVNQELKIAFGIVGDTGKSTNDVDFDWFAETTITGSSGEGKVPPPLGPHDRLIVCVGPSSALDETAARHRGGGIVGRLRVVRYDTMHDLAESMRGATWKFDGVDAVVLVADRESRYEQSQANLDAVGDLRTWLSRGGRLTIIAGPDYPALTASSAPLVEIAPTPTGEPVPLPRATGIEQYVGGDKPIGHSLGGLSIPRVSAADGVLELSEGDLPLVVRRAFGFGALTTILVDLEHESLRTWTGASKFLAQAMRLVTAADGADTTPAQNLGPQFGYDDLAGQLRGALDQYDGVKSLSFFTLGVVVLVLVAVIAPLDFFLVRKVLKRPELTWLTFVVLVGAVVFAAHQTAKSLKGDRLRVSRVNIIDGDAATGLVRGSTFAGAFSPESRRYDVALRPPNELAHSRPESVGYTSWFGLHGTGLGGMHARTSTDTLTTGQSEIHSDGDALHAVPIDVWSSKMFLGRRYGEAAMKLHEPLQIVNGRLVGKVRNPFPLTLTDAVVCHEDNAFVLGDLAAGGERDLLQIELGSLQKILAKTEYLQDQKRSFGTTTRSKTHDPGSVELADILREMMFYDAAGGRIHAAGLSHYDERALDLSELLKLHRAILVGRVADAELDRFVEVSADGKPVERPADRGLTVVRLVIPVAPASP